MLPGFQPKQRQLAKIAAQPPAGAPAIRPRLTNNLGIDSLDSRYSVSLSSKCEEVVRFVPAKEQVTHYIYLIEHDMIEFLIAPETGTLVLHAKGAKEEF
jgi:hypothetical protein